ncbi:MAG: HlyD family type I secretion periplasmic adaptor subunit, partial [Asticcacaulis sp.]|nr:HlyD family type I secretion periplasmic adaptor subunit [Asticcacaulis sp.]
DLKTREARLLAEQAQAGGFSEPIEFAGLGEEFRPLINSSMEQQRKTMAVNRNYMASQLSVLDQRVTQTREQITGNQEQMTSNQQRQALTRDELKGVEDLNAQGYAPTTRVRALQESIAGLEGEYGALKAQVASAQAQIGETQMQAVGVRKQYLDQVMSELNDTQGKLKTMEPQLAAARQAYERLHIRAPATGKVMGLSVFTVGGVIAPGQKLMDIVPDATPLVIQVMIEAKDGNDIHPGQEAQVRFTSLHERDVPILSGTVLDVSGDSFVDKDNNRSFYTGRVQISPETLATLNRIRDAALKPGLPVEVVVPLRKRTVLQYILEPLNQSLWKTFRES